MATVLDVRLGAAMLLAACATAPVGGKLAEKRVEFESYSVDAPAGDWGLAALDRSRRRVRLHQVKYEVLSGRVTVSTAIYIFEAPIAPADRTLAEERLADLYRDQEVKIMEEEGVKPGTYKLKNVRKAVETVAGYKMYSLRYGTATGVWGFGGSVSDNGLFLYFPPDFSDRRAFYGFLISKHTVTGNFESSSLDLRPLEEVIASFRLKKPAPGIHPDTCGQWTSICTVRCSDGTTHAVTAVPCVATMPAEGSACSRIDESDFALACPGGTFQECGNCTPWKQEW